MIAMVWYTRKTDHLLSMETLARCGKCRRLDRRATGMPVAPFSSAPQFHQTGRFFWDFSQGRVRETQRKSILQEERFPRSPSDFWLAHALQKAHEGNRNAVGFWLACQLRDDHMPEGEARNIILTYMQTLRRKAAYSTPRKKSLPELKAPITGHRENQREENIED